MLKALDLFCCAGGATKGLQRAGFHVTGVDVSPRANYCGDRFIEGDALTVPLDGYDFIWASPPCQAFSLASGYHRSWGNHPDLVDPIRRRLIASDTPSVIENVIGAPVRHDLVLCGELFDLRVHRHRIFELQNWFTLRPPHVPHRLRGAKHNCDVRPGVTRIVAGNYSNHADACDAMGIDWMDRDELREAIPPAYSEYIARKFLAQCSEAA